MEHFFHFVVVASLAVLSPGPGVVMTIGNAAQHGRLAAAGGILGLAAGALLVGLLATSGINAVLESTHNLVGMLKLVGAGYLIYLGARHWRVALHRYPASTTGTSAEFQTCFMQGALLQLSNPKVLLFMVAVFPQFLSPQSPAILQLMLMVVTFCVLDIVIHAGYALVAQRASTWLVSPSGHTLFARVSGTLFVLYGVLLAQS